MRLVVGTNFDDNLIKEIHKYPVKYLFGSFKKTITGHGRASFILPDIEEDHFKEHIDLIHKNNMKFLYVMNSAVLNGNEYSPEFNKNIENEIEKLVSYGVDGFIAAMPFLIGKIRKEYPDIEISASSFARISTMREIEEYKNLDVNTIILNEDTSRDFKFLENANNYVKSNGMDIELITDNSCLFGCPYRRTHDIVSSLSSKNNNERFWFEYPLLFCATDVYNDPKNIIKMRWIRPEDTEMYEDIGIDRFKIASRTKNTSWILKSIKAYSDRNYDGNLLDILSYPQGNAVPGAMAKINGPDNYSELKNVYIDNKKFPGKWLNFFKYNDCNSMSCEVCGYCDKIAYKTMSIGSKNIIGRENKNMKIPVNLVQAFKDGNDIR